MSETIMTPDGTMGHREQPVSLSLYAPLHGHIPDAIYTELSNIPQLTSAMRIAHFLGQCHHESQGFTHFTENLNYSAQALLATFPRYFNPTTAQQYARQPERIANRVYANRMGNGPESSGDGWYHKGVGAIQLTGASNQQAFFRSIGLPADSDPTLIASTYPLTSAAWFFTTNGLWAICDQGVDIPTITTLTHRINGAEIGLADRISHVQEYYRLLTV